MTLEFIQMGFHFHDNIRLYTTSSLSHNLVPQMGYVPQLQSQSTSRQSNDLIAGQGRTSQWAKCLSQTSALTSLLPRVLTSLHEVCLMVAQFLRSTPSWAFSLAIREMNLQAMVPPPNLVRNHSDVTFILTTQPSRPCR